LMPPVPSGLLPSETVEGGEGVDVLIPRMPIAKSCDLHRPDYISARPVIQALSF
jgi:hypothetical protein